MDQEEAMVLAHARRQLERLVEMLRGPALNAIKLPAGATLPDGRQLRGVYLGAGVTLDRDLRFYAATEKKNPIHGGPRLQELTGVEVLDRISIEEITRHVVRAIHREVGALNAARLHLQKLRADVEALVEGPVPAIRAGEQA